MDESRFSSFFGASRGSTLRIARSHGGSLIEDSKSSLRAAGLERASERAAGPRTLSGEASQELRAPEALVIVSQGTRSVLEGGGGGAVEVAWDELSELAVVPALCDSVKGLLRTGTGELPPGPSSACSPARRSAKLGVPLKPLLPVAMGEFRPASEFTLLLLGDVRALAAGGPWRPVRRAWANPGLHSGALGRMPCLFWYFSNVLEHLRYSLTRADVITACIV